MKELCSPTHSLVTNAYSRYISLTTIQRQPASNLRLTQLLKLAPHQSAQLKSTNVNPNT